MAEENIELDEEDVPTESIVKKTIYTEMKESYMDYAMSVIVGRALPDARDGLKPVHRRVLYAMQEIGNYHNKPYKKSARIVGEVLGKYHPHGDAAIYQTIVRMVQDFSMRHTLIDGQGNFGSIDGDNAAAMRYTEVRMDKIAEELLRDLDMETVDFIPNFDGSLKEPVVLPAKFPNLLVNGSSGIAVGMATNIPPHNLGEVCDALVAIIENPAVTSADLLELLPGPDFPTGGTILGRSGIAQAYTTGRGTIRLRGKAEIEKPKSDKGKEKIVVTELPYQVNKAALIEKIADLVKAKRIQGITDIHDRSDQKGMMVVIDIKRGVNSEVILNQLYSMTQLENTFGIINLALVNNEPKVMPIRTLLEEFLKHRVEVVKRRSQFELKRDQDRAHLLEGLQVAVDNIDPVVKIVKGAKNPNEAKGTLVSQFSLSDVQAQAILDMKLSRLTGLEREKLEREISELRKNIEWLQSVLADESKIHTIIRDELIEIKGKYADKRRTTISEYEGDLEIEDLIPNERVVIMISKGDYIKRMPLSEYKQQKRGGSGVIGTGVKEEDVIKDLIIASTHDYLLVFTDRGYVHWLKVFKIPTSGRYSMGKAIVNLLELENEKVAACIPVTEFKKSEFLTMATKKGTIKKTDIIKYSRPRKGGIIAITLKDGDDLIDVRRTDGMMNLILTTRNGYAICFKEKEIREIGRTGQGVRGIKLRKDDEVVSLVLNDRKTLLTVTSKGYGKRTDLPEYRVQSRGGKGIINIKLTEKNGKVVDVKSVEDDDEVLLISSNSKVIRVPAKGISVIGRNTQGVRLMRLAEGEEVVAVARLMKEGEEKVINENEPKQKEEPTPEEAIEESENEDSGDDMIIA